MPKNAENERYSSHTTREQISSKFVFIKYRLALPVAQMRPPCAALAPAGWRCRSSLLSLAIQPACAALTANSTVYFPADIE
jgi:hypothetical protein